MLIEFRCTNETDYDAATGRMVICDHPIIADDADAGTQVRCEGCNQLIEVPANYHKSKKEAVRPPTRTRKKETLAPKDVMSMDFDKGGKVSAASRKSKVARCPKCGAGLQKTGRCSKCKFVEQRYDFDGKSLEQIQLRPAGFQLWLQRIIGDGVSPKMIGIVFLVLITVLYLFVLAISIVVGGIGGYTFLFFSTVAFVSFTLVIIKSRQVASDPRAKLGLLAIPWNLLLVFARMMNWQGYDAKLKGRKIIDLRNAPVNDATLENIDGLAKCNVLDLQNSLVSDGGLRQLYGLKNLQCLVLINTKVSHEGVVRLQQAKPKLWIWY